MNRFTASPVSSAPLRILLALALLLTVAPLHAERIGFLTPVDDFPFVPGEVITRDGTVVEGSVQATFSGIRGIKRIKVRQADGNKLKLRARDVEQVRVPVDTATRVIMVANATTTIEKAARTDYDPIHEVNEVIFDSLTWPGSDTRLLVQRVNSGFDDRIQVYAMRNAREGTHEINGILAFGDEEKAFLVVKDGAAPIRVKKRTYRAQFDDLFGDCPAMAREISGKIRFRDFAAHVAAYDLHCGH